MTVQDCPGIGDTWDIPDGLPQDVQATLEQAIVFSRYGEKYDRTVAEYLHNFCGRIRSLRYWGDILPQATTQYVLACLRNRLNGLTR